jgi:shikimate dehydrogenase
MTLSGKAKLAGVIGWPIGHSLSPLLHGHWLQEHRIDGAMVPLAARRQDFALVVEGVRRAGFRGLNVTVPHKEAAFALAHRLDEPARIAGAVNLLVFHSEGLIEGRNTDALGLMESLRQAIGGLEGQSVILLGAGGAARGAVLALDMLGAERIDLLNRDANRAAALANALGPHVKASIFPGGLGDWDRVAAQAVLAVNSTSAGMATNPPPAVDLAALNAEAAVCDIVYNPLQTQFLKDAAALGHKTIDGLGMLMHQALPSFEAFFDVKPQVTQSLRAKLEKVLGERQG